MTRTSHSSTFPISADDSGKELSRRKHKNSQSPLAHGLSIGNTGVNKLRNTENHTGQKKERMENREMCH